MTTYVTAFIFYTLAMIGILLIGFVVYKKTFMPMGQDKSRGIIKIIDSLPIGNKKMLHVVKIKNEKFLIASGLEHTTFLAKLENSASQEKEEIIMPEVVEEEIMNKLYEEPKVQAKETFKPRFDDTKLSREMELQKQFKELYSKEETPKINKLALNRKEMIKKLLKDLNEDMSEKSRSQI